MKRLFSRQDISNGDKLGDFMTIAASLNATESHGNLGHKIEITGDA